MTIRPSSLPMLAACPRWESGGETDITNAGTKRHAVLRRFCSGDKAAIEELPEDERPGVEWAADYIEVHAASNEPRHWEEKQSWTGANFETRTGTRDLVCGPDIFDLKWRQRDYTAQMADYALALLDTYEVVTVHILFAESQKAQRLQFDREAAEGIVGPIIDRAKDQSSPPTPCEYCGWCSRRAMCSALLGRAVEVAKGYSDSPRVQSWHPSEMQTGEEIGYALWVWRTVLKKWGESIEFHALEALQKKGLTIPGFEPKSRAGKKYITDVAQAFNLLGLPQSEFLAGCQVRLNTSKKYPDQKGLLDLYKAFHGFTKAAPAKREILTKLAPVIKQSKDSIQLRAVKGEEEDETETTE